MKWKFDDPDVAETPSHHCHNIEDEGAEVGGGAEEMDEVMETGEGVLGDEEEVGGLTF